MEINFDNTKYVRGEGGRECYDSFIKEYFTYGERDGKNYYSWNDYRFDKENNSITICLRD